MDVAEPVSPLSPHRQDRSVPVDHMTHVDPEWEEFQQFKRQKEALRASVTPRASTTSASVYSTPSLQPPTPLIDPYRMVPLMNKSTPRRTAYATPRTSTWAQREVDHSARGFDYDDTRHCVLFFVLFCIISHISSAIAHVRRTARPAPAEMVRSPFLPPLASIIHFFLIELFRLACARLLLSGHTRTSRMTTRRSATRRSALANAAAARCATRATCS